MIISRPDYAIESITLLQALAEFTADFEGGEEEEEEEGGVPYPFYSQLSVERNSSATLVNVTGIGGDGMAMRLTKSADGTFDGVYYVNANDVSYNPSIIQWSVFSDSNTSSSAHVRFGLDQDDGDTICDVWLDSDGLIKLDNGVGTNPEVAMKYKPNTWYHMRLYLDWHSSAPQVVLTVDAEDDDYRFDDDDKTGRYQIGDDLTFDGYLDVAHVEAKCLHCSNFAQFYVYNYHRDVVAYVDNFAFRDARELEVSVVARDSSAENPQFVFYTRGNSTDSDAPVDEPADAETLAEAISDEYSDVCEEWASTGSFAGYGSDGEVATTHDGVAAFYGSGCMPGDGCEFDDGRVLLTVDDEFTALDAVVCGADGGISESAQSITYGASVEPPSFTALQVGGAEEGALVGTSSSITVGTSSITVTMTSNTSGAYVVYTTDSAASLACSASANSVFRIEQGDPVTLEESVTVRARACRWGREPSALSSSSYSVKVFPPSVSKVASGLNADSVFIDWLRLRLTAVTPNCYIVYTLGDGTQDDPFCDWEAATDDETSTTQWPETGSFTNASIEYVTGVVTLNADVSTGIKVVACKASNADSIVVTYTYSLFTLHYFFMVAGLFLVGGCFLLAGCCICLNSQHICGVKQGSPLHRVYSCIADNRCCNKCVDSCRERRSVEGSSSSSSEMMIPSVVAPDKKMSDALSQEEHKGSLGLLGPAPSARL